VRWIIVREYTRTASVGVSVQNQTPGQFRRPLPQEYHNAEFAGKAAEFDVKINEVLTAQMPEINDEFINTSNSEAFDQASCCYRALII
jgi:FKBP-type peptidyl-prolyl cis-trans isomerase (trigger factor)